MPDEILTNTKLARSLIIGPIAALILGNGEKVPDPNLRAETK